MYISYQFITFVLSIKNNNFMKTTKLLFIDNRVDKNGNQWKIEISLDDDCKNGHQDFSLTGTCWEKGNHVLTEICYLAVLVGMK